MSSFPFEGLGGELELNDVISCVWCKRQPLTQLVQLGCFHLACKVCLQEKLEEPKPGATFNCPECDMSCMVPLEGLDRFPDEPLQHKMNQVTAIFSNDKPNCKFCEQVEAKSSISSVCITCKINLCESDAKRHQGTPGHKVVSHEELFVEPNLSLMLKSKAAFCQKHASEKNYFCKKCEYQICPECVITGHSDHNKDSVLNIATEYRKILEEKMGEVGQTKRTANLNIQKMKVTLAEIEEKYRKSVEKFQHDRKGDRKAKENLQKIEREVKLQRNQVNVQVTEEKNKIKQCESAEFYMKVFLKCSSDSDVIDKFDEFFSCLENCEIIEEYEGGSFLSDKMQGVAMSENVNENMRIDRMRQNEVSKNVNEAVGIEANEIGKTNENLNEMKDNKGKKLSGWDLEAKWKAVGTSGVSVCNDEILAVGEQTVKWFTIRGKCKKEIDCAALGNAWNIDVCEGEMYVSDWEKRVILVLDKDGRMKGKLSLPEEENSVDWSYKAVGLAVDKGSKDIYVSSDKTGTVYKRENGSQHFIPWITEGLNGPCYICVTPDHHLVVSNWRSHTVIKYSPHGKIVWKYGSKGSGEGRLSGPQGVCTDPFGHIFIADHVNHRLVVVSGEGKCLKSINFGDEIVWPEAVSFGNERLVVTTNMGQVFVLKWNYS